jgi:hypothetical protein
MKSDGDANPWQVIHAVSQRISQGFGAQVGRTDTVKKASEDDCAGYGRIDHARGPYDWSPFYAQT